MKDPGGTNNVLPVARLMRNLSTQFKVKIIADANGKAPEILRASGEKFEVFSSAEDVRKKYSDPHLMVTSMCSGDSIGRDLVPLLGTTLTVTMPDSPWGRYEKEWCHSNYWPHWLIVNDRVGARIAKELWNFPSEKIKILGWPFLDKYCGFDIEKARRETRIELLNLGAQMSLMHSIVLFTGQLKGTSSVLRELVAVLNEIGEEIILIPRLHPRSTNTEKEACEKALGELKVGAVARMDQNDIDTLIAAADVTVSMYSLTLVTAAALRRQNISVLTYAGLNVFYNDIGVMHGLMTSDHPFKLYSCIIYKTEKLQRALEKAFCDDLYAELAPCQKEELVVDGMNAWRVMQFLKEILGIENCQNLNRGFGD